MTRPFRPTRDDLAAAYGVKIPDVIAPGLDVLFCGINPGLYSGATGNHFARPGNRFWPALHLSGFTPRQLHPSQKEELLALGLGITNVVDRTTARADELTPDEIVAGGRSLRRKVRKYAPRYLAVLGLGPYRVAFGAPRAAVGPRPETIGETRVWLLPNPSGLNAHYQLPALAEEFVKLRRAVAGG
ncbi:MAG: G/U mismatch-specific DNA glycosylase [Actinomycetota bacterium]|nr:G/U mismatch-specific DNA glycosylase [Actinomycetota bacterium]